MNRKSIALGPLLAMAALCSGPLQADIVTTAEVDRYVAAAGADLDEMRLYKLRNWRVLDGTRVVFWNERRDPYLITVDEPCPRLEFSSSVGISSSMRKIMPRIDSVMVGDTRCRVERIQALDKEMVRAIASDRAAGKFSK